MALGDPTQNPTPAPAADPTAAPTTAPVAAPTAAPVIDTAAAQASAQANLQTAQTAYKQAAEIANTPSTTPPVPHQRLLQMVQGLAQGLSAAGTAIATRGKEGGAPQVAAYYAQQQDQKIKAQQAATAQKNAELNQKMMVGDTAMSLSKSWQNLATLQDDMELKHVQLAGEVQRQAGEAQTQSINKADFMASHGGMAPDEFNSALSGTAPASGATGASAFFTTNAQQQLSAASKVLGADDPYVQKLQTTLSDPKATPKDLWLASTQVQTQLGLQEKATTAATQKADLAVKEQAADPLFKFQSDPKALVDPGAQAMLRAYIDNPANKDNLNGIAQAKTYITQAGIAQQHAINLEAQKASATKTAEQLVTSGTPQEQGQALYDGSLTLADLKSRGSSPKQIVEAQIAANNIAKAHGTTYNASDEIVGEHALGEVGNQTFYGSGRSLVQHGGMLDQLKAAHDALGNGKIPVFNKYSDWLKYQAGTPELATYRAKVLGAADDYAKVIGGGTPSDSARQAASDQFIYDMNQGQFDGSVEAAREAVRSQVKGRIGSNRYIQQREGDMLQEHQPGDTVTLKNGQTVVIKSVGTDGTFTY